MIGKIKDSLDRVQFNADMRRGKKIVINEPANLLMMKLEMSRQTKVHTIQARPEKTHFSQTTVFDTYCSKANLSDLKPIRYPWAYFYLTGSRI